MTKEELRSLALSGIIQVRFVKTDGTERTMRCTLLSEHLPQFDSQVLSDSKKENPNVLAVWDLDAQGWRSFRVDSVQTLLTE
jgi:hypothetical protein